MVTRYRTHGPLADRTVERDFEGRAFGITERGAIMPGTISAGGIFVPDPAHRDNVYLVNRVEREVDTLAGFAGFANMGREAFDDVYFVVDEGATQAFIPCASPQSLPDSGAGPSGHLLHVLDADTGIVRGGGYPVDVVSGNVVYLVSPMLEEAPGPGTLCVLEAERKLLPRAADFPNPSVGFRSPFGGNWFVVDQTTGGIFRVTAGTELVKVSSGSGACDLRIGWTDGNANVLVTHKRRGRWDDGAITGPLASSAQAQLRRGTSDQHELFTGAAGELTYDTDRKILRAQDGATAGGEPVAKLEQFSTTEHDTGQRAANQPVYERSFVLDLTVDGAGNLPIQSTAHLISGIVFGHASKPVWLEATWHLNAAAAISGAYASVPLIGSTYMVVVDPSYINVSVIGHTLGALRLFLRLRYCRT